jgi:hypothetical protein
MSATAASWTNPAMAELTAAKVFRCGRRSRLAIISVFEVSRRPYRGLQCGLHDSQGALIETSVSVASLQPSPWPASA